MNRGYVDPWAREKMTRSEAQRRYQNLVQYQLRPMLNNRSMTDDARVNVLKRIVREASRFKYEAGVVAGAGTREEVMDLIGSHLLPEHPGGDEYKDWIKRAIRAFGATVEEDLI
jgi:hypothetical protein